jgi:hypothetical protein
MPRAQRARRRTRGFGSGRPLSGRAAVLRRLRRHNGARSKARARAERRPEDARRPPYREPGIRAWWRGLGAQARRWLPRRMSWLRFLCLSSWQAWRHLLGADVGYGQIYIRDRFRCLSPVCSRRDVTPIISSSARRAAATSLTTSSAFAAGAISRGCTASHSGAGDGWRHPLGARGDRQPLRRRPGTGATGGMSRCGALPLLGSSHARIHLEPSDRSTLSPVLSGAECRAPPGLREGSAPIRVIAVLLDGREGSRSHGAQMIDGRRSGGRRAAAGLRAGAWKAGHRAPTRGDRRNVSSSWATRWPNVDLEPPWPRFDSLSGGGQVPRQAALSLDPRRGPDPDRRRTRARRNKTYYAIYQAMSIKR